MGGRGARFGVSEKGKPYGTEYKSVLQVGRIKFVKQVDDRPKGKKPLRPKSVTAPMETMTKGRIYVTIDAEGKPSMITFYRKGKRTRQIDLDHPHEGIIPHTHKGYFHKEKGTRPLTKSELNIVDKVKKIWHNEGGA